MSEYGQPLQSVVHPTDFSPASLDAFAHALRIAIANRCLLHILHIDRDDEEAAQWDRFPHVRDMLAQWRLIEPGASRAAIAERLGVKVVKVALESNDAARGIGAYVDRHLCDLLVLSTRERKGLLGWLQGSVAEAAARETHAPTLFLREGAKGFVDRDTGAVTLRTVLLPIDARVSPLGAWKRIANLARTLEADAEILLVHVGETTPIFQGLLPHVELRQGPVVETILAYAEEIGADLIAMPTEGRHGVFDALRGSTTEQVLREAPCPVLAVPAR
jgi:nucleotide-binding universal stress UspA family protein